MDYYVYVLRSELDGSYYKGFTQCPLLRLSQHNSGETQSTRSKRPWQLVYLEIFTEKSLALKREKSLKKYSHAQLAELIPSGKNQLAVFLKG